jgi:hypothetical protein
MQQQYRSNPSLRNKLSNERELLRMTDHRCAIRSCSDVLVLRSSARVSFNTRKANSVLRIGERCSILYPRNTALASSADTGTIWSVHSLTTYNLLHADVIAKDRTQPVQHF